jgi:hypothetical protein
MAASPYSNSPSPGASRDGLDGGQPGPVAPDLSSPGPRTDSTRTDLRARRRSPIGSLCSAQLTQNSPKNVIEYRRRAAGNVIPPG